MSIFFLFFLFIAFSLQGSLQTGGDRECNSVKPTVDVVPGGIWISNEELMTVSAEEPEFLALLTSAKQPLAGSGVARANGVLARSLIFNRTGDQDSPFYDEAMAAFTAFSAALPSFPRATNGQVAAVCRQLLPFVVSAELLNVAGAQLSSFHAGLLTVLPDLQRVHETDVRADGAVCGAARVGVTRHLGRDLSATAQVFARFIGLASATWTTPAAWTSALGSAFSAWNPGQGPLLGPDDVLAVGQSTVDGSGSLPADMSALLGSVSSWPPTLPVALGSGAAAPIWQTVAGLVAQAELLFRAGYDTWRWRGGAVHRALEFLLDLTSHDDRWWAGPDTIWAVWLVNARLDVSLPTDPAQWASQQGLLAYTALTSKALMPATECVENPVKNPCSESNPENCGLADRGNESGGTDGKGTCDHQFAVCDYMCFPMPTVDCTCDEATGLVFSECQAPAVSGGNLAETGGSNLATHCLTKCKMVCADRTVIQCTCNSPTSLSVSCSAETPCFKGQVACACGDNSVCDDELTCVSGLQGESVPVCLLRPDPRAAFNAASPLFLFNFALVLLSLLPILL